MDEYTKRIIESHFSADDINAISSTEYKPNKDIISVITTTPCKHGNGYVIKYNIKPHKICKVCHPTHTDGKQGLNYVKTLKDRSVFETLKSLVVIGDKTEIVYPDIQSCSFYDITSLNVFTCFEDCLSHAKRLKEQWKINMKNDETSRSGPILNWAQTMAKIFRDYGSAVVYRMGIEIAKKFEKNTFPLANAHDLKSIQIELIMFIMREEGYIRDNHNIYKPTGLYKNSRVKLVTTHNSLINIISEIEGRYQFPVKIAKYAAQSIEGNTTGWPKTVIERRWIGFRNGVFDVCDTKFIKLDATSTDIYVFMYFDEDFPEERFAGLISGELWKDIEIGDMSAAFNRLSKLVDIGDFITVCKDNKWCNQEIFSFLVEWGRMSCNKRDFWNSILFIIGENSTGKSQLLNMLMYFVPSDTIFPLPRFLDDKFSMEDSIGKSVIKCDDMVEKPNASSKLFNYIADHTQQNVGIKYAKNSGATLTDRCAIACNVPPIFKDMTDIESNTRRWSVFITRNKYSGELGNVEDNYAYTLMKNIKIDILVAISYAYKLARHWRSSQNNTKIRGEKVHRPNQLFVNRQWVTEYIYNPKKFKVESNGIAKVVYPEIVEHTEPTPLQKRKIDILPSSIERIYTLGNTFAEFETTWSSEVETLVHKTKEQKVY